MQLRRLAIALLLTASFLRAQSSGVFTASDFGAWSLPSGITPANGILQWQSGAVCNISSNGYNFTAVKIGRPLTIVDAQPTHTETVIPTSVTITASTCTVGALMTYTHSTYTVRSGTAGLQEAIDYAARNTSAVISLTPSWAWLGGTTGMVTSAQGNLSTTILDQRTSALCSYTWDGAQYAASGCSSASTITSITAGTAMLGGGGSGDVRLDVDTTLIPFLNTTNEFTLAQTFDSSISAQSLQIGVTTVLPAGLLGFHGAASGSYVQGSDGTGTNGNCVKYGLNGILTDAGAPCGAGGGGGTGDFGSLLGGSNSTATMNVASGASLQPTGTGVLTANGITGSPSIAITNLSGAGTVTLPALEAAGGSDCLQIDNLGHVTNTGFPCGTGGQVNSGTSGQFASYPSNGTTVSGNTHLSDAGGLITATEDVVISDGTAGGGAFTGNFGTAPTSSGTTSTLWADSGASRWKMNNAGAGGMLVPGIASSGTSGNCVKLAPNGIDILDAGAACGSGSGMSSVPASLINDGGVGTGPTSSIVTGSTDGAGWMSVTVGTTPTAGVGALTLHYGGTYATIPKCGLAPANAAAAALSGTQQVYIDQSHSTTSVFVLFAGTAALTAGATYTWRWSCSL